MLVAEKIMMAVLTAMQEQRDRTASGNPAS
jgi:hypothetical protein